MHASPDQQLTYYILFFYDSTFDSNTVEALVSDHLGNSEKWSQIELVA